MTMGGAPWSLPGGNIADLLESRKIDNVKDINWRLHCHSSLIQRLELERELEGHEGCVNSLAWNKSGTFLISGSDDLEINVWNYVERKLSCSVDTGHTANIFCTRFIPETGDEIVASGAGDAEVRVFNLSQTTTQRTPEPLALFRCHSGRVKKLAVEPGNPNVLWSASEDGSLRQHDLREGTCCPSVGSANQECGSVLLDLRSGAKKSLGEPPKHLLALKSCDISPTRPHQILVGGSDAFGRLYDRRMLPSTSSFQTRIKAPSCVTYFCPIHLSERRSPSLHLTHVAFSPTGEELLMSYSGEHVYLMDVNYDSTMKYSVDDIPERTFLPPALSELEAFSHQSASSKHASIKKRPSKKQDICDQLLQAATHSLENNSDLLHGIEVCCEVLERRGQQIDDRQMHDFLCVRAALFLKRNWRGDAAMAIRDCRKARETDVLSFKTYFYMAESLQKLGKHENALDFAMMALYLSPSNSEVQEQVKVIKERIASGQSSKENGGASNFSRLGDANSEREDSDFDEMELDIVTSMSGDENNDLEPRAFRPSLNLILPRDTESHGDSGHPDRSAGSPSSSSQNETDNKVEYAVDMKQRYVGHCNVGTDIKQASFLGRRGEFIASGSDDGRLFIWEKITGRLIKILVGDETVVNCIQCHPFDCAIATSGIDNTIKLWTPHAQMAAIMGGTSSCPEAADVLSVLSRNQKKLMRSRGMPAFEFLERLGLSEYSEGNLRPFECVQS
ncbi:transducin family protein / WD-40 repeat family protein isoform X2 [Wolffia australiana]